MYYIYKIQKLNQDGGTGMKIKNDASSLLSYIKTITYQTKLKLQAKIVQEE